MNSSENLVFYITTILLIGLSPFYALLLAMIFLERKRFKKQKKINSSLKRELGECLK
jgi:hypothetical protein